MQLEIFLSMLVVVVGDVFVNDVVLFIDGDVDVDDGFVEFGQYDLELIFVLVDMCLRFSGMLVMCLFIVLYVKYV